MPRYLYSFDISLACTGMVIFDLDTFEHVVIDHFKTNSKRGTGERLRGIEQEVLKYMKLYPPYEFCNERGFSNNNFTSTQQIFKAQGVILCRFWQYEQHELSPSHWKKIITGNGGATKERVQEKLVSKIPDLKFKFKTFDESDAYAIGLAYMIENYGMPWTVLDGGINDVKQKSKTSNASTRTKRRRSWS